MYGQLTNRDGLLKDSAGHCDVCGADSQIAEQQSRITSKRYVCCKQCFMENAEPLATFEYLLERSIMPEDTIPLVSFVSGEYITYGRWIRTRHATG